MKKIMIVLLMMMSPMMFAEGTAASGTAAPGVTSSAEHLNGCGPNSTCGECITQSTGTPAKSDGEVDATSDAVDSAAEF